MSVFWYCLFCYEGKEVCGRGMIVRSPSKRQSLSCFWSEKLKVSNENFDTCGILVWVYNFTMITLSSKRICDQNFYTNWVYCISLIFVICDNVNFFCQFLSLNGDSCWTSLQTSGFQPEAWHQFAGQHSRMHVQRSWRTGIYFEHSCIFKPLMHLRSRIQWSLE